MKSDPKIHHRRSIRLKGYGYSQVGAYFVTNVTRQRECLFGEIASGEMKLNNWGEIVDECWHVISEYFPIVELGAHIVMPNHFHGIIAIGRVWFPRPEKYIQPQFGAGSSRPYENQHWDRSSHILNINPPNE